MVNHELCSICPLDGGQRPCAVETICGHTFCAKCLIEIRKHHPREMINCPRCNRRVSMFLHVRGVAIDDREEIEELVRYNNAFAQIPGPFAEMNGGAFFQQVYRNIRWRDLLRALNIFWALFNFVRGNGDLPAHLELHGFPDLHEFVEMLKEIAVLYRHLGRFWEHLPWTFKLDFVCNIIFFIVYLLSPIDALPEALFGPFGYLDDAIIGIFTIMHFANKYRRIICEMGVNYWLIN